LQLSHYRSQLGLSLSEETPFEGTLKENITFGNKEISDETIFDLLDNVGLGDYVKELPQGIQTVLQPDGKQISYTIAKKIILARAIAKQPKVLILEDPLDRFNTKETEKIIQYITNEKQPWSLIVVSSNPIWAKYVKATIRLENGKIESIKG
jgi:ABC-type bacteriocin/lantibiotic exporter with double-glycine peptidase domain